MSKITLVTFPGFYFRVFVSNMLVNYFEPLEQKKRKIELVCTFSILIFCQHSFKFIVQNLEKESC